MRSLVTSIFRYACESGTLTVELERRTQATEMKCYRKILHVIQMPCYQRGSPCQDPAGNWTTCRPSNHRKEMQMQWYGHVSCSLGLAKTTLQGTVKGGKKTRQTEEEVGRQHQGMDRPVVQQVPEAVSYTHLTLPTMPDV